MRFFVCDLAWGLAASLALAADSGIWTEFPVEPQKLYSVECELEDGTVPGEAALLFLDKDGRDVSTVERTLGFAESVARKDFPAGESKFTLSCRAGSESRIRPVRGVVRCEKGGPARVRVCRSYEGVPKGGPKDGTASSAGIASELAGDGAFARNLAPNGSFEEIGPDGAPVGWRWVGKGRGELSPETYAGDHALKLTEDSEGGRWETEPILLSGTNAVQIMYAAKFSRYAQPYGHLDPVRVEYLRRDAAGSWKKVLEPSLVPRMEFAYAAYRKFYGEWFPAVSRRHPVPAGAEAIRIFCEHRERRVDGRGGAATWGDILVDNVAVYQSEASRIPAEHAGFIYAPILFCDRQLPPQLPAGRRRENSVTILQEAHHDGSMFFAAEHAEPSLNVLFGNLIAYTRNLLVCGRITDAEGRQVSEFSRTVRLRPFAAETIILHPGIPKKFGAYEVHCDVFEGEVKVATGTARFAWAAHRSRRPRSERYRDDYPFDMHLGAAFNYTWNISSNSVELQSHLCEMLGVRGVRVQMFYEDAFNSAHSPEEAARAATELTERFRKFKEPALRRHGIKWWPSLMEQGSNNLPHVPRTDAELAAWRAWHRAFAASLDGDADFVLFGNEGLGGYNAHLGPDESLRDLGGFCGTTREWWVCCRAALEGLKEGDRNLLCGISHASDERGLIAKRFKELPEGGFDFDCWGVNSYVNPEEITAAVARELGAERTSKTFGVIPEIGHGAYKPEDFIVCAKRIPQIYLMVKADVPWVKRLAWFILGQFDDYGVFDSNFAPRPAAVTYLTMVEALGAGKVEKSLRLPDGGRFFIWRKADGTATGAGWSPKGLPVPLLVKGNSPCLTDIFGNAAPLTTKNGETVLKLGPDVTYVTGAEDIAVAKTINAAIRISADRTAIEFAVRNLRKGVSRMTVTPSAHPLVRLEGSEESISLGSGEKKKFNWPFVAYRTNDGRRLEVRVTVREETGAENVFAIDVSGMASLLSPKNLIGNPGMDEWREKDHPDGWGVRIVPGEGGKVPQKWETRRCADDGFLSDPSAAIWVDGSTDMLWARIVYFQNVSLKPNTRYYFSAAMRMYASGHWPFPLVYLRGGASNSSLETVLTSNVPLPDSSAKSCGWTRREAAFETGDVGPFSAECELRMQNIGIGEVRYDDIELFEIGPARKTK